MVGFSSYWKVVGKKIGAATLAVIMACALFALPACSSAPAASSASASSSASSVSSSAAAQAQISVTVTVSAPEGVDFEAVESTLSLDEGATVLDALEATGLDVLVSNGQYGAFVESIGGLANGAQGPQSGWVYTVNGEYGTESAGVCKLANGDSVEWTFMV